jgi:hypothetical protein
MILRNLNKKRKTRKKTRSLKVKTREEIPYKVVMEARKFIRRRKVSNQKKRLKMVQ